MNKMIHKILLSLFIITVAANAGVLYVDNNLGDGFWQNAYDNLQDALTAAQSGDEIWVAQGTYVPGMDRDDSFTLKEGVKLYGGFYGGETSLQDRDSHNIQVILSGEIGISDDASDNCRHVLSYSGSLSSATIVDGFIIRDGYADDGNGGGGLLLENGAAPLIRHCRFVNNVSTDAGGAAHVQNAVSFDHCLFEGNSATSGGAVASLENRIQEGMTNFDYCTFVSNVAGTGSALYFEKRETALIDSSIFWNNTDGSGQINSLSLDTKVSSSSITYSAFDDASVVAVSITGIINYTSTDADGPFLETDSYHLDNNHGIPRDWGWYYVPAPLVLNIKIFLEGTF